MNDFPTAGSPLKGWLPRLICVAILPALVVYALALSLAHAKGVHFSLVIRDLAQTCGASIFIGAISNLGYLLWMAAAAISLFTALSGVAVIRARARQMLVVGGAFSLILCLDDMFLLHDRYVNQNFLYASYIVFAMLLLFYFRPLVARFGGGEFLVAVVLMGASIAFDKLQSLLPIPYNYVQVIEEGVKFAGAASWLYFWWRACVGASRLPIVAPIAQL